METASRSQQDAGVSQCRLKINKETSDRESVEVNMTVLELVEIRRG